MDLNQDGPVNIGLKLSLQDPLNVVYNFDVARIKNLIYGGLCVGVFPIHAGCLFALDTTRNCLEKEETKFTAGLVAFPGKTRPWSSPPSFPVFNFLGVQRRRPGVEISVTAAKRLDDKISAGVAVGLDGRENGTITLGGFASYEIADDTTASFYINRHLSTGFAVTRQLNAYHSVSIIALLDPGFGLRFGLDADYRPEPPLLLQIKYKIKGWKQDVVGLGGGGGSGGGTEQDILALQEKIEFEAKKTLGAAKKNFEDAKRTWNELLNRN